jgi:hypothetical protein
VIHDKDRIMLHLLSLSPLLLSFTRSVIL